MLAKNSYRVLIGSYLNFSALVEYITNENKDLLVLCAGWKNKFNLEDTLFAGALTKKVLENKNFYTICDSTIAAIDLWNVASPDLLKYIDKIAQRERLRKNNLDDVIEYCHTFDQTKIIPVLKHNYLIKLEKF